MMITFKQYLTEMGKKKKKDKPVETSTGMGADAALALRRKKGGLHQKDTKGYKKKQQRREGKQASKSW